MSIHPLKSSFLPDICWRSLLKIAAAGALGMAPLGRPGAALAESKPATQNSSAQALAGVNRLPLEWTFVSNKAYGDPYNEVTLNVVVTDPQGKQQTVPAFWAGGQVWKVRYGSHGIGQYT